MNILSVRDARVITPAGRFAARILFGLQARPNGRRHGKLFSVLLLNPKAN